MLLKNRIAPCVVPKLPATPATLIPPYSAALLVVARETTAPATLLTVVPYLTTTSVYPFAGTLVEGT